MSEVKFDEHLTKRWRQFSDAGTAIMEIFEKNGFTIFDARKVLGEVNEAINRQANNALMRQEKMDIRP